MPFFSDSTFLKLEMLVNESLLSLIMFPASKTHSFPGTYFGIHLYRNVLQNAQTVISKATAGELYSEHVLGQLCFPSLSLFKRTNTLLGFQSVWDRLLLSKLTYYTIQT